MGHEVHVEIVLKDLGLLVGDELQDDVVHVLDSIAVVLSHVEVPQSHHLPVCRVDVSNTRRSQLPGSPRPVRTRVALLLPLSTG